MAAIKPNINWISQKIMPIRWTNLANTLRKNEAKFLGLTQSNCQQMSKQVKWTRLAKTLRANANVECQVMYMQYCVVCRGSLLTYSATQNDSFSTLGFHLLFWMYRRRRDKQGGWEDFFDINWFGFREAPWKGTADYRPHFFPCFWRLLFYFLHFGPPTRCA